MTTAPVTRRHPAAVLPARRASWWAASTRHTVPLSPSDMDRLVRDAPARALWDPLVSSVALEAGRAGEPGMVCRVVLGNGPVTRDAVVELVASDPPRTVVLAGHVGRRCRFIEVVEIVGRDGGTEVSRRLELLLSGSARLVGPLLTALARRYLRRSFAFLT
jgi:hypothetical protein